MLKNAEAASNGVVLDEIVDFNKKPNCADSLDNRCRHSLYNSGYVYGGMYANRELSTNIRYRGLTPDGYVFLQELEQQERESKLSYIIFVRFGRFIAVSIISALIGVSVTLYSTKISEKPSKQQQVEKLLPIPNPAYDSTNNQATNHWGDNSNQNK